MALETEQELWERIETETGIGLLAELGSGLQGCVYMTEEMSTVAKITHSRLEAATAAFLKSKPHPAMPSVESVHALTIQGEDYFLIVRENLDDILEADEEVDEVLKRDLQNAFIVTKYPSFVSDEILSSRARIELEQPATIAGFRSVLEGVERFHICSGIEVSDINFQNIGRRDDGSFILRDFGMSHMSDAVCEQLTRSLPRIPDGENSHIRKSWR
jgi:hypothetical protein